MPKTHLNGYFSLVLSADIDSGQAIDTAALFKICALSVLSNGRFHSFGPIGPTENVRKSYPLGLVLKACPEISDYATAGIVSWRDLMQTAAQVRSMLGISPSAYEDALDTLGQENTAIVVACIVQRSQHISSAGGYLRVLTMKARAGEFSVGPMLMASLKASQYLADVPFNAIKVL